jgi:uncharacterized Ntn-hydrolase superfamily protein
MTAPPPPPAGSHAADVGARAGTYSIVACDPATAALGVAVQSHWFSVGSVVSWARTGVGAVATQSVAERAYGPRLLDRLEAGEAPSDALAAELAGDELGRFRQVGVVDSAGSVAAHTGDGCMLDSGHLTGDGFSVQANLMASPEVWPRMASAFEASTEERETGFEPASPSSGAAPFARRLLESLRAAEEAGGDVRGRQSAAILIAPAEGERWQRVVDLRIEDHPHPLGELARLLDLHEAYALAEQGDTLSGAGRHEEAANRYRRASSMAPENHELLFWAGLALAHGGDLAGGSQCVKRAIVLEPGWRQVLAGLRGEIAPGADSVRAELAVERDPRFLS